MFRRNRLLGLLLCLRGLGKVSRVVLKGEERRSTSAAVDELNACCASAQKYNFGYG